MEAEFKTPESITIAYATKILNICRNLNDISSSRELCALFNLKYHINTDEMINNSNYIYELGNHIKLLLAQNTTIKTFIIFFSNPAVYSGTLENLKVSIPSIKKLPKVTKEAEDILNKIVDAALVKLLNSSMLEIENYYSKKRKSSLYGDFAVFFKYIFYQNWSEFENILTSNFKIKDFKLDFVNKDKAIERFNSYQYSLPQIIGIFACYIFINELSNKDDINLKNNYKFFKNFISSSFKNKDLKINTSLCLYLYNEKTKFLEAYLHTMKNDLMKLPSRSLNVNRNGKRATIYRKIGHKRFYKKMKSIEIKEIGLTTLLKDPGLIYHFLSNPKRYDYKYSKDSMDAFSNLVLYVYKLILAIIDENQLWHKNFSEIDYNMFKWFSIYESLKEFTPYDNIFADINKKIVVHHESFRKSEEYYKLSLNFLRNPTIPEFEYSSF